MIGHVHQVGKIVLSQNRPPEAHSHFSKFGGVPAARLDLMLEEPLHLSAVRRGGPVQQHLADMLGDVGRILARGHWGVQEYHFNYSTGGENAATVTEGLLRLASCHPVFARIADSEAGASPAARRCRRNVSPSPKPAFSAMFSRLSAVSASFALAASVRRWATNRAGVMFSSRAKTRLKLRSLMPTRRASAGTDRSALRFSEIQATRSRIG